MSFKAEDRIRDAQVFCQAEDGIRDAQESRGLGDVYKRQETIPSRAALWAENGSHKDPETIACSHPIITGRKSVAPPIAAEPCFGPACPKFARSCAIVQSHAIPTVS